MGARQFEFIDYEQSKPNQCPWLEKFLAETYATLITRRHAKGAVVMSLDTYNSLKETMHLLRSPANAAHLRRLLDQADRWQLSVNTLIHPGLPAGSLWQPRQTGASPRKPGWLLVPPYR